MIVSDRGESDFVENTNNKANEYTTRKTNGSRAKSAFAIADFNTNTASLWDKPGSGDAFDVGSTTADRLTVTTVAQDTFDLHQESEARAMLTLGQAVGPVQGRVTLQFPSGSTTGYAGLVFGYKSANDYWMLIVDLANQEQRVYHVVDGNKTQVGVDAAVTVAAATDYVLSLQSTRSAIQGDVAADLTDGFPSGKIGLVTTVANTQFDNLYLYGDHQSRNLAGRWENYRGDVASPGSDGVNAIDTSIDRLKLYNDSVSSHKPVLLRGLNVGRFEATFSVKRESAGTSDHGVGFVFNAKDQDSFDSVHIFHHDSAQAPLGWEQDDGHLMSAVAASTNTGNIPALSSSSTLWVQVNNDGTNVTVKLATSKAGLSTAGVSFTSTAYDGSGTPSGQVGFVTTGTHGQIISIGDFELAADRDNNGSYETLEHVDDFAIDSNGQAEETLTHDAAGNLTYDGVFAYTYDAWNRLTKMHKAFRNPSSPSTVTQGSLITQNTYNGSGKRISKAITNAGYLNETYNYFYTPGWQLIETRNGSGQVIKQHIWGTQYIDEIIQIAINGDPVDDPDFDAEDPDHDFRGYWAMQGRNHNVLGITDSSGVLVERYEYTSYGKRTVFHDTGSYDLLAMAPTSSSRKVTASGSSQPYGINEIGHQGLMHEEELGLIYNFSRYRNPQWARWLQRDEGRYIDGLSLYQYVQSNPIRYTDPTGLWGWDGDWIQYGVGGLLGFYGTEPMKAGAIGGGQGAAAWADGVIPFADPFANQLGLYDPCDPLLKVSKAMGGISRDTALMAIPGSGMVNAGKWIKNPAMYEIGSKSLTASQYARLSNLSAIDRGRAIVNEVGLAKALIPNKNLGVPLAGTGLTPGATIMSVGGLHAADSLLDPCECP